MLHRIFDAIYEGIKNTLLPSPKSEKEVLPPPVSSAPPVEQNAVPTPPPTVPAQNVPATRKVVLPSKTPEKENISLARGTLSLDQQRALLEARRKVPFAISFLKYFSLILTVGGIVAFLWIKGDLDQSNGYLKFFGIRENTGLQFENLSKKKKVLETDVANHTSKIRRFTKQIEEKNYSVHTATIEGIRDQQLRWFDVKNEEGILLYGILDGPLHMQDYFNSRAFDDPLLSGTGNTVTVKNVTANRQEISFSIEASQLFGKIFALNTEFVKMMNSFPLFTGGSLNQFTKKKDDQGNDSMDFSLKLSLQSPADTDPDDEYFSKYDRWVQDTSQ
ncbi:hypothetical protein K9L63_03770 [Candidatus Gracilibacteria bacterium]|nr:hypothetical protein [Candidatus Gracilibacteria bacterium]